MRPVPCRGPCRGPGPFLRHLLTMPSLHLALPLFLLVRCGVKVLESTGQLPLAYVAASTHGLAEDAARLQVQYHTWPAARHRLLHALLSSARPPLPAHHAVLF